MTSITIEVDEELRAELERLSRSGSAQGKTLATARALRALIEQGKQLDQFREDVIVLRSTVIEALRLLEAGESAEGVLRGALERTRRSAAITIGASPSEPCTHPRRLPAEELPAGCFSCPDCGSVFRVRDAGGGP